MARVMIADDSESVRSFNSHDYKLSLSQEKIISGSNTLSLESETSSVTIVDKNNDITPK